MSRIPPFLASEAARPLRSLADGAHHLDVVTVRGRSTLRQFVSGALGYQPWWLRRLFALRRGLARALGLQQVDFQRHRVPAPEDVPFVVGTAVGPGHVVAAEEDRLWATRLADKHLAAILAVVVDPRPSDPTTFHFVTIVHYQHWTGPLYFNLIRPFHHLVVRAMAKAGVRN